MTDRLSRKHSVSLRGHSTSITLENEFWLSLKQIAAQQGRSVNALVEEIDATQPHNLSSALRVYILRHYKGG